MSKKSLFVVAGLVLVGGAAYIHWVEQPSAEQAQVNTATMINIPATATEIGDSQKAQFKNDCDAKFSGQISVADLHYYAPVVVTAQATGRELGYSAALGEARQLLVDDAESKFSSAAEMLRSKYAQGDVVAAVFYVPTDEVDMEKNPQLKDTCTPEQNAFADGSGKASVTCTGARSRAAVVCTGTQM